MKASLLVLALALLVAGRTTEERELALKAIRMKTTRQLKEIFDELGIDHKGLSKDDLKKKAYKEDAVGRWEKLHPEKAYKKPKGTPGGGMPGLDGMDFGNDPKMAEMLRQMRGDFSAEKDPERKRLLEKLSKMGMSFGGGTDMDTEQLRNMVNMMDGIKSGKSPDDFGGSGAGGTGGASSGDGFATGDEVRDEDELAAEDKMEL